MHLRDFELRKQHQGTALSDSGSKRTNIPEKCKSNILNSVSRQLISHLTNGNKARGKKSMTKTNNFINCKESTYFIIDSFSFPKHLFPFPHHYKHAD